jgi:hypothetical protein
MTPSVPLRLARGLADEARFLLICCAVLALYGLIHAVVLNPVGYLDPWFYTGAFTNFAYLYGEFHWGYWVTRLPWIIPGIAANWIFSPLAAFFVLHIAFFVGGAFFAYLTLRRFFGSRVALVTGTTLMLTPLWFNAHSTDYVDGPTMSFLFAATYFATTTSAPRRRWVQLACAGFFAAAAFGTQIFSAVLIAGIGLVYASLWFRRGATVRREVVGDVGAAAAGATVLLVLCGIVSRAYGGEFLFFMPSWRAGQSVDLSRWQRHGHAWMLQEPQLLIPPFIVVLSLTLLLQSRFRAWRSDPSLRFAMGSAAFLAYLTALLGVWEFWFGGDFLEVNYYFSLFLVPTTLALGACLYCVGGRWLSWRSAGIAIGLAAVPLVAIFGVGNGPTGDKAFYLVLSVSLLVVIAAFLQRRPLFKRMTSVTIVAAVVATTYAASSGAITRAVLSTNSSDFTDRRAALAAAVDLERFMQRNHLQSTPPPAFWYNGLRHPALNGIQSTYLWGITWMGRAMPRLTADNRSLVERRHPPYVVLLCAKSECGSATRVLRRSGYGIREAARGVIGSGAQRYLVEAYEIPKFKPDPVRDWYERGQSTFVQSPTGSTITDVRFGSALPDGWTSEAPIRRIGGVPTIDTSARPWNYEVVSSKTALRPGTYALYLRGRVLRGGIDIGVLDVSKNSWISQRAYWFRQPGYGNEWMSTPFTLKSPSTVQFVLSNWVPEASASRWQLRELRVAREH